MLGMIPIDRPMLQINMLAHVPTAKPLHTLAGHALIATAPPTHIHVEMVFMVSIVIGA